MAVTFHHTYGIDIEIDTPDGVVDPRRASVRTIAVSAAGRDRVFSCGRTAATDGIDPDDTIVLDGEAALLRAVDDHLRSLAPGIVATWNGAMFDLPFLFDRATIVGVDLGLLLVGDPTGARGRAPLPGHRGAHRARWGAHRHLDTFRLYGDGAPANVWASLLGLGRRRGTIVHTGDLLNEALHANAPSDARLARVLAERRGPAALRAVDHLDHLDLSVPVSIRGVHLTPRPSAGPARRGPGREPLDLRPVIAGL